MKNLLYTIVLVTCAATIFTACQKDDSKGRLDPSAKVYISPAPGVKATENTLHLSAREIVLQAENILFNSPGVSSTSSMAVDDWNRDTINNRLMLSATCVIASDGKLDSTFIDSRDMLLVILDKRNHPTDTIAYVSDKTLKVAAKTIREAYDREDYASCYRLFEQAFTFVPITGKEWRALKVVGDN